MLTFRVPTVTTDGVRQPAGRPDSEQASVTIGPRYTEITTPRWGDPHPDAELLEGEAFECEECNAVFDSEGSRNAHLAAHSGDE
jgi:hypothetical protein